MDLQNITFGVEEEFVVVGLHDQNPIKFDFDEAKKSANDDGVLISQETHDCVIEMVTPVCNNIAQLNRETRKNFDWGSKFLALQNSTLLSQGTHPNAKWDMIGINTIEPYASVVNELQDVIRGMFVFGNHVHIGGLNDEAIVYVHNALRQYIPLFISLSANSRYWGGRDTGLASFRNHHMRSLPRSGIPKVMKSAQGEFDRVNQLHLKGIISKPTSVWTDIRLHPIYRTIEVRCIDMQTSRENAEAVWGFVCALSHHLINQFNAGNKTNVVDDDELEHNRWQSCRHGLDAKFITRHGTRAARDIISVLNDKLRPIYTNQGVAEIYDTISSILTLSDTEHSEGA